MKKILSTIGTLALFVPCAAFAAYNDVTLTTSTLFSVNGISLQVADNSAVLDSIEVDGTKITATLSPGASITIQAPSLNVLADAKVSGGAYNRSYDCHASLSYMVLTALTEQTVVTITPSTDTCPASSSGSGGGSGGGGGGGGGGGSSPTVTTTTTTAVPAATTPAPAGTVAALQAQLQALLAQIAALGGKPNVQAYVHANSNASFLRNLQVGVTGDDVKSLQQFLNTHGFMVAKNGLGSPGNETTRFGAATRAALAKFQAANGIAPAVGFFGAKTRALISGMK